MAKFCGNCGTKAEDDARVCGNCGTPFANIGMSGVQNIPGVNYVAPEKKEKNKKKLKKVLGLIIFLVILVCGVNIASNFIGYKGTIHKIMKAYKEYDVDALCDETSEIYSYMEQEEVFNDELGIYQYVGSSGEELAEYFENSMSYDWNTFDEQLGYEYKISYEITRKYELSNHRYNDLIEQYSYYDWFDEELLGDVIVVEVTIEAKEGKESVSIEKDFYLSKEGNSWKLLYWN